MGGGSREADGGDGRQERDLRALEDRAGLWRNLERAGVHPVAFCAAIVAVEIVAPVVLSGYYGVDHRLVAFPVTAVIVINTVISLVGIFYTDRRFLSVIVSIRDAFDLTDVDYFDFCYRLFDRLYTYSYFSPIAPGPDGRYVRPWLVGLHVATFAGLVAFVDYWTPLLPADGAVGNALFLLYLGFLLGYGAVVIVTFSLFVAIAGWYLTHKAAGMPVRIDVLYPTSSSGLEPFGQFVFHTLILGLLAVGVTGTLGLVAADPLLMLAAVIITAIMVPWFVGSQYGLHRAIGRAKRDRLERLYETHRDDFRQLASSRTPEPDFATIQYSHSFIVIKREIEALPEWPVNAKTIRRAVSATVVTNLPAVVGLLPYLPDLMEWADRL